MGRYDQAQLLRSALELSLLSPPHSPQRTTLLALANSIMGYLPVLTSPEGGFWSAEDADSVPAFGGTETREGAFYTWTAGEVGRVLGGLGWEEGTREGEAGWGGAMKPVDVFMWAYGVEEGGNCDPRHDPHGELKGQVCASLVREPWSCVDGGGDVERAIPGAYARGDRADVRCVRRGGRKAAAEVSGAAEGVEGEEPAEAASGR